MIWQVLAGHIGDEAMEKICQDMIKNIKTNQKVSQDLIFVLYKSFYEAQNIIASKCREELIKQSIMTLYRGVITYKPPENDYDIKNLENKIQSLNLQLKEIHKIKLNNQPTIAFNKIEELLTQLSKLDYQSSQTTKKYLDKLIEEAEKDCNVNFYKTTLREKEKGLGKAFYDIFLVEIEDEDELNSIFDANLFAFKDTDRMRRDDSKDRILEQLDEKLFTIPIKPNLDKSSISSEQLGNEEKVAHDFQDNESRIKALKELAPNLSSEQLEQALENARDIQSGLWRAKILGELAAHLSPELLEQALEAARDIQSGLWRAKALGELAAHLSPELLEQALGAARDIQSELWRAKALGELAPHLPPKLLEQALEAARGIQSDYSRGRALEELTPHLSP